MRTILTDLDDTILRFGEAFGNWARREGFELQFDTLEQAHTIPDFLGCSRDDADKAVIQFSRTESEFGTLRPENCASHVVPLLRARGYEFVAISSCVNGDEITQWRAENLERAFGFRFKEVHLVGLLQPKEGVLRQYEPSWWVEDNGHHAVVGAEIGHRAILLDKLYNRHIDHPQVTRVPNWHHVFETILRSE